ncbi:ADP-ribosylglycohydrolase family protein [Ralstonia solanacearum]|uniref:ADP-ribosylglycohydrolase family protein n=1 Tax=Ralstonia solanacearum TaxID=305 RepID=UPI0018D0E6DA|nr:ADP-ribosylglycohydrolase family protein [Ralstonia solanacearum]
MNNNGFAGLLPHRGSNPVVGGLIGLLVGDAVGAPYEFNAPEDLPDRHQIDMVPPIGFRRSHAGVPPGTWSDDGSQALCLAASLLECGKFSLTDFADRLLRWYDTGYLAVDGDVFDVGNQTADALDRLRDGMSPLTSGGASVMDNGNGSAMRCLPLTLCHTGSDEELVRLAQMQSLPTHAHPRSLVSCAYLCMVGRGYLNHLPGPWAWADQRLTDIYQGWPEAGERQDLLRELDVLRNFLKTEQPRGTGYVLDTVHTVRRSLQEETFEDVVKTAILFGNDTDTNAAIAGCLAGCRDGLSGVPVRWLELLRGFELVEPLTDRFGRDQPPMIDAVPGPTPIPR